MVNEYTAEKGLEILEYLRLNENLSEKEIQDYLSRWDFVFRRRMSPLETAREIYTNLPLTHGDGNGGAIDAAKKRAEEFDRKVKEAGLDFMLKTA